MDFNERIVARLRLDDDGALSNKRVEQYALLRSEEVCSISAAWLTAMAGGERKKLPNGRYQGLIHSSPHFKYRLEQLMAEKAQLEEGGVWGRLEWQARQQYRWCAAMKNIEGMQRATDTLLKIALTTSKPKGDAPPETPGEKRGPGAPPVESPLPEDAEPDYHAQRLLEAK